MSRAALTLIAVFVLFGALFSLWQKPSESDYLKKNLTNGKSTAPIAHVIRDVKEGATITSGSIEDRELPWSKIPPSASSAADAIGKKAKYGLSQGQIVSQYDLDPLPPNTLTKGVRLIRETPKGTVIQAEALEEKEVRAGELPPGALFNAADVLGRKATVGLKTGQYLSERDLSARKEPSR